MKVREVIQALLDGKKVRNKSYTDGKYIYFNGDDLLDDDGEVVGWCTVNDDYYYGWELAESALLREIEDKINELNQIGYNYTFYDCSVDGPIPTPEKETFHTEYDLFKALVSGSKVSHGDGFYYFHDGDLLYQSEGIASSADWSVFDVISTSEFYVVE